MVAAEVAGSVSEKQLLDALFSGAAHLNDLVETHMSAAFPSIGSNEAVSVAVDALETADAVLVQEDGKPDRSAHPSGPAGLPDGRFLTRPAGVADLHLSTVALLALAGFAAGFIDAVVGGGGLIQLPALVLALPGAAPIHVLATNKISSVCGTTVASATYYRRVRPHPGTFLPLMGLAFLGSLGWGPGGQRHPADPSSTRSCSRVLVVVGAYVLLRPELGEATRLRFTGGRHLGLAMLLGLVVGFYDGALGPGTGSFFVFTLVGLLGYSFLEATAKARMANWATNVAALVIFVPQGAVLWGLGLVMGACNLAGGYLGARVTVARGSSFVRRLFMAVVLAFVVRLALRVVGVWP